MLFGSKECQKLSVNELKDARANAVLRGIGCFENVRWPIASIGKARMRSGDGALSMKRAKQSPCRGSKTIATLQRLSLQII